MGSSPFVHGERYVSSLDQDHEFSELHFARIVCRLRLGTRNATRR
ncbi:hypothetical protein BURMUCF1_B0514 [Burkholderia multivorans ATCC BAA-247]|nr:hypothetical protein BURMUCGD2M_6695 [Burkholderia multivorans CGD2M]EJO54357.1 hypothetical protein BURMUCF1_B0514 [Burkholderia multivorans ATCC BAA-247]